MNDIDKAIEDLRIGLTLKEADIEEDKTSLARLEEQKAAMLRTPEERVEQLQNVLRELYARANRAVGASGKARYYVPAKYWNRVAQILSEGNGPYAK